MGFISRAFAVLAGGLCCLPAITALTFGFPYGSQKVRGVNLGGWLVLEVRRAADTEKGVLKLTTRFQAMDNPSLFDNTGDSRIVDEFTFGQFQDHGKALATLTTHWNTWITESDFAAIAAAGLNHVRLPIGYWAFDVSGGEPFVQGQLPFLMKAVTWAQNHGLKLIVDLHGAPGSQNGFDNSGQKMDFPQWQTDQDNIDRTNAIIKRLASMFAGNTGTVSVIAPLNEPAGFDGDQILAVTKQYWFDSYGNIRFPFGTSQQSNTVVMIHDAFQPISFWNNFMPPPNFQGVILDTHIYQMFSVADNQKTNAQHISAACAQQSSLASSTLWTVVGEWTPAANDCARNLNGRGVGSRFDGSFPGSTFVGSCTGLTGKASSFSASYKTFLRQYWEAQVISYERGNQGWIQWTWKAENADEWSYQAGLANGWIPQNPTSFQFPNICG